MSRDASVPLKSTKPPAALLRLIILYYFDVFRVSPISKVSFPLDTHRLLTHSNYVIEFSLRTLLTGYLFHPI